MKRTFLYFSNKKDCDALLKILRDAYDAYCEKYDNFKPSSLECKYSEFTALNPKPIEVQMFMLHERYRGGEKVMRFHNCSLSEEIKNLLDEKKLNYQYIIDK